MNKVFAIIGPPASGKSTIVNRLYKENGIPALVSHTTRQAKKDEQDGVDYYFVDKAGFSKILFVERTEYSGCYYGLSKDEVMKKVSAHPVSLVDIDLRGFEQLKKILGERVESIYVLIDKDTLMNRCLVQGDSMDAIQERIEYAEKKGEFNNWQIADHVVKNTSSVEVTLRQVLAIMGCPVKCGG